MGKGLLNIKEKGKKIGDRGKRLDNFGERIGIGIRSKALDKAVELANRFLDMKKEKKKEIKDIKEKWNVD